MGIITPEKRKELLIDAISHEDVVVNSFTIQNDSETLPNIREGINQSFLTGKIRLTIELTNRETEEMFIKKRNILLSSQH